MSHSTRTARTTSTPAARWRRGSATSTPSSMVCRAGWHKMLEDSGFDQVTIGPPVDTFGGARGEANARSFEVYGYAFLARRP
jgi:hypothetical protein